jgi:FkbM family methyltransferase
MARPRPMISYAQNLEDVLLDRALADVEQGFYVDVGANDPDHCSLTRHFYEHGWRGINVEPGTIFEKLRRARPRDINLNIAISNANGTMAFHEFPAGHGLSTLEAKLPDVPADRLAGQITRQVPVRPLRDVFAEHQPPQIDFMSIDVEGHERAVLVSNDWSRWRPRILVIEAILPLRPVPCHQAWEDVVLGADYLYAFFDGLNRYYVRHEDADLLAAFSAPVNVLDNYIHPQVRAFRDSNGRLQRSAHRIDGWHIGPWVARQVRRIARALRPHRLSKS